MLNCRISSGIRSLTEDVKSYRLTPQSLHSDLRRKYEHPDAHQSLIHEVRNNVQAVCVCVCVCRHGSIAFCSVKSSKEERRDDGIKGAPTETHTHRLNNTHQATSSFVFNTLNGKKPVFTPHNFVALFGETMFTHHVSSNVTITSFIFHPYFKNKRF